MKKIGLVSVIFSLILFTTIIKNTTKQIEDELFTINENLRVRKISLFNLKTEFRIARRMVFSSHLFIRCNWFFFCLIK